MAAEKISADRFISDRSYPKLGLCHQPSQILYAVCLLPTNSGNLQKMRWYATFLFFAENKKLITLSLFFKKQRIFSFQQGAAWFRLHFCASRTTDLTFPRGFVETSCRRRNVSRKRLDFFHNSCYNKIVLLSAFVCPEMGKWQQKSTHSNRICFDFPIFRAIFPCRCSRT